MSVSQASVTSADRLITRWDSTAQPVQRFQHPDAIDHAGRAADADDEAGRPPGGGFIHDGSVYRLVQFGIVAAGVFAMVVIVAEDGPDFGLASSS